MFVEVAGSLVWKSNTYKGSVWGWWAGGLGEEYLKGRTTAPLSRLCLLISIIKINYVDFVSLDKSVYR
jgi:hypothetical protein